MRPGSPQRRLPIVLLIEAESLAAAGEPDRAAGALERVIAAVGVDEADALRAGVPGRLTWPLPAELLPSPARAAARRGRRPATRTTEPRASEEDARTAAAARAAGGGARVAYVGRRARARRRARWRSRCASIRSWPRDGVAIMEPTLGGQPAAERLLLYGDLLRAAGRRVEADRAYDRAADRAAS